MLINMRVRQVPLIVLLTILTQVTGEEPPTFTFKCCGVNEQLDPFKRCVNASWPHANPLPIPGFEGEAVRKGESWVQRWYPPGPGRDRLVTTPGHVVHSTLLDTQNRSELTAAYSELLNLYNVISAVHRSYDFEEEMGYVDWNGSLVTNNSGSVLVRIRPDGRFRKAMYCVDAIRGYTAPYAVLFNTIPDYSVEHFFYKCCRQGQLLVSPRNGRFQCKPDRRAWTTIMNSSLSSYFDAETPVDVVSYLVESATSMQNHTFHTTPIPPGDSQYAQYIIQTRLAFLSSTWVLPCADFERNENGEVTEVMGYFVVTRRARAGNMISRHLSFVSALILLAALAAISCKERMRNSAHGWALACHSICLLLFNIGQTVYYFTMSDWIDRAGPCALRSETAGATCLAFAIPMYFLLISANAWLTALCANMHFGFKLVRNNRGVGAAGERKRFLKLSAFAWSVAVAFTVASVSAFVTVPDKATKLEGEVLTRTWYRPTFTETRTCYMETGCSVSYDYLAYRSQKLGTLLYYYLPSLVMVAANGVFLFQTGRKVRYLRRGNSLLKRDEREGGGRRKTDGHQEKATSEPKSATVYVKLLLTGGVLEFIAEFVTWVVSSYHPSASQPSQNEYGINIQANVEVTTLKFHDHMYAHRITGYCADLFRALVVLWLAVPEPPDVRAVWRRMRGEGGDSPAQGAATRPAPRPNARHAPRRGQQESAL